MSPSQVSRLPLGLPSGQGQSTATLGREGVREQLEELERRGFSGRLALSTEEWQAEVLLRDGRPIAVGAGRPGLVEPLRGQAALTTLLAEGDLAWECRREPIEGPLLEALEGLSAAPTACDVANLQQLRDLLLELAESGQRGLLHIDVGSRWARAAIVAGRILGSYSDTAGEVLPTLAPFAELLGDWPASVRWFSAAESHELFVPAEIVTDHLAGNESERQITWILSRFEGAWGRARERGASSYDLEALLRELIGELRSLNQDLDTAEDEAVSNSTHLTASSQEPRSPTAAADPDVGLNDVADEQDCGLLVQLVARMLDRAGRSGGDPGVAEICRKAALALPVELGMGSRPRSETEGHARNGATP